MKRNTRIFIKTTSLVLAFMLLLGVGIMSLSFSHSGVKPNDSNFLTPDLAITAPTSQELLQRKFNAYNTVTEENGKSVITIFSEEQIKDFNNRRNNGEWFSLSSEEAIFLISDTEQLFKNYDIIRIRDTDGTVATYFSKNDTLQNYTEAIYNRVTVFNPNLGNGVDNTKVIGFNVYSSVDAVSLISLFQNIDALFSYSPTATTALNDCYYFFQHYPVNCGVLVFYNDSLWYDNGIYFFPDIKNIDINNIASYRIDF